MKKIALIAVAALAFAATPAMANTTSGSGIGIGGTIGLDYSQAVSSDFSLNGANDITGGSGSGFNADLAGSARDSLSIAAFGGLGIASTHTDVSNYGVTGIVNSTSWSAGAFGGVAYGQNADFEAKAMNFAQSEGRNGYEYSLDVSAEQSLDIWAQLGGNVGGWSFEGF